MKHRQDIVQKMMDAQLAMSCTAAFSTKICAEDLRR